MRSTILLLIFTLSSIGLFSQTPIGYWKSHAPMASFLWVGESENFIYAANKSGILAHDRDDNSNEVLTKVNLLSSSGISAFKCATEVGVCIVGYENGNLDLITDEGSIVNQPAIMNSQAAGNKTINDISIKDGQAWLATGIGVLLMDLTSFNILENTNVQVDGENQNVLKIHQETSRLLLSTEDYVVTSPTATIFTNPTFTKTTIDVPAEEIAQFATIAGTTFALHRTPESFLDDTLYALTNNTWTPHPYLEGLGTYHIQTRDEKVLVTHATSVVEYDEAMNPLGTIFTYGPPGMSPSQALYSEFNSKILIADIYFGGVEVSFSNQYGADILSTSSPNPYNAQMTTLAVHNGTLYALPGGNEYTYNRPNIHAYQNNGWISKELTTLEFPEFVNGNALVGVGDELYIASDRGGLAVANDSLDLSIVYTDENSPLKDFQQDYRYFGIAGMDKDAEGNLYLSHAKSDAPLKVYLTTGEWLEIEFEESDLKGPKTSDLIVLENGIVLQIIIDIGILAYDPMGTPDDLSDDRHRLLTSSPTEGSLPSSQVTCMTEDLDGEVWIGTSAGIGIIYTPDNIFEPGFTGAEEIIVKQDGYFGYLFETETIEAIAVDGANRKWIGTFSSGLFQVSEDGLEQLQSFTPSNSPLLNDKVTDLAIIPKTGELFVASENGLISYRSDATSGASDLEDISIFPNPVRSGYSGPIAISNVTSGSYIRITDAASNLVFETRSLGGQAIWNGTNMNGERVGSGMYLVYVTASDGSVGKTEKILFLN